MNIPAFIQIREVSRGRGAGRGAGPAGAGLILEPRRRNPCRNALHPHHRHSQPALRWTDASYSELTWSVTISLHVITSLSHIDPQTLSKSPHSLLGRWVRPLWCGASGVWGNSVPGEGCLGSRSSRHCCAITVQVPGCVTRTLEASPGLQRLQLELGFFLKLVHLF